MVAGLTATGFVLWRQKQRGDEDTSSRVPKAVLVPGIIITVCGLILLVAFTAGGVAEELQQTSTESLTDSDYKLAAWSDSAPLMGRHPWTGIGRGAFEHAFTRVHPSGTKTYSYVENEYLQVILDWGFPCAAALGLLLIVIAMTAVRRSLLGPIEAGALGALTSVALQNAVDFNLELPGIALAALTVLAILTPVVLRKQRNGKRRRLLRTAGAVAALAVIALAASPFGATAAGEAEELSDRLHEGEEGLVAEALVLTERHPSDYVAAGLAAQVLASAGDQRAVKLMNRALALNPAHSGLHLMAAQMLSSSATWFDEESGKQTDPARKAQLKKNAEQARSQSLIEFALSLETASDPRLVINAMLARYKSVDAVVAGLPTDPLLAIKIGEALTTLDRTDIGLAYARRVRAAVPKDPLIARMVAEMALVQNDTATALSAAEYAHSQLADGTNTLIYAKALAASAQWQRAETLLAEAIPRARSRGTRLEVVKLLTFMGEVKTSLGKLVEAKETLVEALAVAGTRVDMAAVHRNLAVVETRMGDLNQAAWEMRRAESLAPTRADVSPDAGPPSTVPGPTTPPKTP